MTNKINVSNIVSKHRIDDISPTSGFEIHVTWWKGHHHVKTAKLIVGQSITAGIEYYCRY